MGYPSLVVIGIPGQMLLLDKRGEMHAYDFEEGSILCSNEAGDEMYILRPFNEEADEDEEVSSSARGLYETFTHRNMEAPFRALVHPFVKARPVGRIAIIRYQQVKNLDEDSTDELIEWEHYFEAPDYAQLVDMGNNQFLIPPGKWRITERGIVHSDDA